MGTFIYWPPLKKTTGGMRVLAQLANQLAKIGCPSTLVVTGSKPADVILNENVRIVPFDGLKLTSQDKWIVPEGWPNALSPGLKAGSRCCVFVQNWMPFHGLLPNGLHWNKLPVAMLAISNPVMHFIKATVGRTAEIVPPAIDSNIFYPERESAAASSLRTLRIAFMPRKNKALINQIRNIFEARTSLPQFSSLPPIQWIEINGKTLSEVGDMLRNCHIFLSAGFPEGFGLPPLEAMACGCVVAGFTGMGGWEYMRQASTQGATPLFPIHDVPWGANGFYASDGDVWGAVMSVELAIRTLLQGGRNLEEIRGNGLKAARWYSEGNQAERIAEIWAKEEFWLDT